MRNQNAGFLNEGPPGSASGSYVGGPNLETPSYQNCKKSAYSRRMKERPRESSWIIQLPRPPNRVKACADTRFQMHRKLWTYNYHICLTIPTGFTDQKPFQASLSPCRIQWTLKHHAGSHRDARKSAVDSSGAAARQQGGGKTWETIAEEGAGPPGRFPTSSETSGP